MPDARALSSRRDRCFPSRADGFALAFLAVLAACILAPALLGGRALLPLDLVPANEPWRSELGVGPTAEIANPEMSDGVWEVLPGVVRALTLWRQGVPLWDPLPMNGVPAWASGKNFTHPLALPLAALLGPVTGLAWTAFLQLVLAGWGLYGLARELRCGPLAALTGALSFELGGYLLTWIEIPYLAGAIAWSPWVFWGIERAIARRSVRPAAGAALAFALQVLSGYVLGAYLTAAGAALLFGGRALAVTLRRGIPRAAREVAVPVAVALLGGAGLAAIQLLPTAELFRETARSDDSGPLPTLPAAEALRWMAPRVLGRPVAGDHFTGAGHFPEGALYLGVLPLAAFAAAVTRRRIPGALGYPILALVPALGVLGLEPGRSLIIRLAPMLASSSAARTLALVACAGSVAVALGAEALFEEERWAGSRARWAGLLVLALVASLGMVDWLSFHRRGSAWIRHPRELLLAASLALAGIALLAARQRGWCRAHACGLILVALTTLDLARASAGWNRFHPATLALPSTPSLEALAPLAAGRGADPPARVLPLHSNWTLPGRSPERFAFATPSGYSSWVLRRSSVYADLSGDRPRVSPNHVYYSTCCGPLTDALGVGFALVGSDSTGAVDPKRDLLARLPGATVEGEILPGRRSWRIDGVDTPILFEHAPTTLRFAIGAGQGRRLRTAIAIDASALDCPTDGAGFRVVVVDAAGEEWTVFSRFLDPVRNLEDRGAHAVELDLDDLVPRARQLVLSTDPGPRGDFTCDWAGWVAPRLESRVRDPLELVRSGANPIFRNRDAFPRAWLVHAVDYVPPGDLHAAARKLRELEHELRRRAVVESDHPLALAPPAAPEETRWLAHDDETLTLEVEATANGLLVLPESFYPGWRAWVDGVERPVLATNLAMRGVAVPAGRHRVDLRYMPRSFRVGAGLSLVSLGALAAVVRRSRGAGGAESQGEVEDQSDVSPLSKPSTKIGGSSST